MYIDFNYTICAPATTPGTGAISVIRVSGEKALEIADKVVSCKPLRARQGSRSGSATDSSSSDCPVGNGQLSSTPGYTVRFGTVHGKDGGLLDEVLVSVFHAPHSYTGEDSAEISCHASKYIVEQIMLQLMEAGARAAEPGEFTRRAFLNGKMDLAQAEAVADVIAAQSAGAHRIAMNQMKGGFSSELKEMRSRLLEIVSLMELELDFSEEEVEFADRTQLRSLVDKVTGHISKLIDSFRLGNAIKNGVPVAIAGATNTGKSTLLNALLGEERAIVSDVHGTTRDTVEETMNIDGILFRFIDTAGIRETSEAVEKIGIERTWQKISQAQIILGMLDLSRPETELAESLSELLPKIGFKDQDLVLLLNKCDLISTENYNNKSVFIRNILVSFIDNKYNTKPYLVLHPNPAPLDGNDLMAGADAGKDRGITINILPVSAKRQDGIQTLKSTLASMQKDRLTAQDTTLVTNLRHIDALTHALDALTRVRSGLDTSLPTDLISQDIREALYHLGSIIGEISTDEVLGEIFGRFCIGK